VRAAAGADLGGILGEGDVADVVQGLDGPVPPDEVGEAGRAGLLERQAGDRLDGHGLEPPGAGLQIAGLAGDLQDLRHVGEADVVDADDLEGAHLDAAVAAVAGAVQHRDAVPGQALAAVQQEGLVGLDDQQVVGVVLAHMSGVKC
jgi:hypothetical protein